MSYAGDKIGGDKVTLDDRRRPLPGVSTTLDATVGLREAAVVTSVAVGGCREVTCLVPVADVVRVESAVI